MRYVSSFSREQPKPLTMARPPALCDVSSFHHQYASCGNRPRERQRYCMGSLPTRAGGHWKGLPGRICCHRGVFYAGTCSPVWRLHYKVRSRSVYPILCGTWPGKRVRLVLVRRAWVDDRGGAAGASSRAESLWAAMAGWQGGKAQGGEWVGSEGFFFLVVFGQDEEEPRGLEQDPSFDLTSTLTTRPASPHGAGVLVR